MNKRDISAAVKPLSPTAARVLLVLIFGRGISFTGKELSRMLGKSQNTISTAVNELEFWGFAQNNGRQYGWSLPSNWRQKKLFSALQPDRDNDGLAVPVALHDRAMSKNGAALHGHQTTGYQDVDNSNGEIQKNLELQKNLDLSLSSSSSSNDLSSREEEKEGKNGEIQKNLELRQMLINAGVGARSPKLNEILITNPDPDWVAGHIHVWETRREPVGYLITRILDGDTVPGCDCSECTAANHIPAQYRDIVKR